TKAEDQLELPIQSIRKHKSGLILKTPALKDRNAAELLKGYAFYIPTELLSADDGEQPFLFELRDFVVTDPQDQLLGEIKDFGSNGIQDLLVVRNAKGDFEVPFVEQFVVEIDYEAKTIKMDLPEGLVELPEKK